jgi:ketosteroid isomerase-like protein
MSEQDNVKVVQDLFAAFGRGDFARVLGVMTDDVEWRLGGPTEVATPGIRRGRDTLAEFFKTLSETSEFEKFEAQEFIAQRDKVVALGHERQRVKATGQVAEVDWAMVFTLRDGKVAKFRNYEDTAAGAGAPRGR